MMTTLQRNWLHWTIGIPITIVLLGLLAFY
jgi:hypothetical protein